MTPKQIWITVGAVAAALVLGIGITLLATGGDSNDSISTAATRPSTPSTTAPPSTTTLPLATTVPTTAPPAPVTVAPTTPPPTVIIITPTEPPTVPPTVPPTSPPTTPPTVPPTTAPPTTTTTVPSNAPTITKFEPLKGPVGTPVVITGTNLTDVDTVKFGGVEAEFTVDSPTQITAVVPAGAVTGKISVEVGDEVAFSVKKFKVTLPPVTPTTIPCPPTTTTTTTSTPPSSTPPTTVPCTPTTTTAPPTTTTTNA